MWLNEPTLNLNRTSLLCFDWPSFISYFTDDCVLESLKRLLDYANSSYWFPLKGKNTASVSPLVAFCMLCEWLSSAGFSYSFKGEFITDWIFRNFIIIFFLWVILSGFRMVSNEFLISDFHKVSSFLNLIKTSWCAEELESEELNEMEDCKPVF